MVALILYIYIYIYIYLGFLSLIVKFHFGRRLLIFPKRYDGKHFSIYLEVVDFSTLPAGWSVYAQFRLAVINQIDPKTSIAKGILLNTQIMFISNFCIFFQ